MLHALSLGRKTLLTQQLSASFLRPVGTVSMQTPLRFLSKKAERAKAAAAAAGEETMGAETVKTPVANSTSNALRDTLKQIEKDFGKDAIMRLGSKSIVPCEVISTGSIGLDAALGVGGLPRGRITEIYGPESSGKTSLTLHVIAEAQKLGGTCMFIDAEHALDIHYAQQVGVNTADLYISQPNSGEQALEIADKMIISGAVDVIVVDSVASLLPRAELEGEMGDHHIGKQARLMSQALRKLCHSLSIHKKTVLIFTNQIRMKVGVLFGSPETTPGGNALKFYSSVRLDSRKIAVQKKGDDIQGIQVRVTVVKNKVSPPLQKAIFDLEFGKGISKSGELVDLGVNYEILSKSGSWYSFRDRQLAQGRDKMKTLFEQDPVLAGEVSSALRQAILDPHNTKQVAAEEEEGTDVESVAEVVAEPAVE